MFTIWQNDGSVVYIFTAQIEDIGTESEMRNQFGSFSNEIDFNEQTIIPGLNDAHIHVWKIGHLRTYMLDVRGVKSIVEFKRLLNN